MPRKLTPRSSLTHFTREAKRWLKALRAGDPDARARLARALADPPAAPTLRDIQHALAREFDLSGWTALRDALAIARVAGEGEDALVARFLDNACPDHHVRGASDFLRARHTALRLLTCFPDLADASFQTEIVCGDLEGVRAALAERPELAAKPSGAPEAARSGLGHAGDLDLDLGPKGWEPLLYLCYARLPLPAVTDNALAIATTLLDAGADPDAWFPAGDCRFTALVGVIGEGEGLAPPHPRRDELVRLLLERGAEPYDLQVQYNIHFQGRVLWWLELVYEYSLRLGRRADWDNPGWAHMDMGGYGNGARWYLDIAIKHHDPVLAEWCLAHGADPNAAPARSHLFPQHSLHETAIRAGATEIAALLVRYGANAASIRLTPADELRLAALRLDREAVMKLMAQHPRLTDEPGPMFAIAAANRADAMALLLEAGVSMEVENGSRQRALHAAAYSNALDVARLLVARGAEIDPVETTYGGTPLGHATYARNQEMMDFLAERSRDLWELASIGKADRVRQLLAEATGPVKLRVGDQTPLMWLPADDEARAIEVARVLLAHGADPAAQTKEGRTAADRAERLGMYDLAGLLREAAGGPSHPSPVSPPRPGG